MILPDLHWTKLFGMPSWAWSAIVIPPILWLIARSGAAPAQEKSGVFWQRPSIGMYLMMPIAVIMLPLFGIAFFVCLIVVFQKPEDAVIWVILVCSPVGIFAGVGIIWMIFFQQIGFNDVGIVRRKFRTNSVFPWSSMEKIRISENQARVLLKDGRKFSVSKMFTGFNDLIATARSHGVAIET